VRDRLYDGKLLERCVRDVRDLLGTDGDSPAAMDTDADVVFLWDEADDPVAGGSGYGIDF
jgi:CRISPR-associated protein Cas1